MRLPLFIVPRATIEPKSLLGIERLEERALLAANLQIVEFNTPPSTTIGNGQQVELNWTVTNNGVDATVADFWFDSVYLSNDNSFDESDLLLSFQSPTGVPLAPGESYSLTDTLSLPADQFGDKYLILVVDDGNLQAESDEADNTSIVPITLNTVDVDLTQSSFGANTADVVANQPFLVYWSVANQGTEPALATRTDRIYLSTDDFFNLDDTVVYEETRSDGVYTTFDAFGSAFITLPENLAPGTYYLFTSIDSFNDQYETNDFNNGTVLQINVVDSAPNLKVTDLTTDPSWTVGQEYQVNYTISNDGTSAAVPLQHTLYLSSDQTVSDDDIVVTYIDDSDAGSLAVGDSYSRTITINAPYGIPDNAYLLLVADSSYLVSETDESDNIASTSLVIEGSRSDLTTTDFQAQATAVSGSDFEITAAVLNQGGAPSASPSWLDGVYLSTDDTLDDADILVGSSEIIRSGEISALFPNESYSSFIHVNLPSVAAGSYYLIYVADSSNQETELDETNNSFVSPIEISGLFDLSVTNLIAPSDVILGNTINVSFDVANIGTVPLPDFWTYQFYISDDSVFDSSDQFVNGIGPVFSGTLDPGVSTTINGSVQLTNGAPGIGKYLLVRVGVNLPDNEDTNNVTAFQFNTTAPDIKGESLVTPTNVVSGQTIQINYTARNIGTVPVLGNSIDKIYLSTDTSIDIGDVLLDQVSIGDQTPIDPNHVYSITRNLFLPSLPAGTYYIIVQLAAQNQPDTDTSNNVLVSSPITFGVPDLIVSAVNAPSTAILGDTIQVTYTVKNQSTFPTGVNSIFDRVYLSDDDVFDSSDKVLATSFVSTPSLPLAAGQSYPATLNVALAQGTPGAKYLIVRTDALNNQAESNETNNYFAVAINLSAPDLTVSIDSAPSGASIGQTVNITYTVTNTSAVPAPADWIDRIYLATDAAGSSQITLANVSAAPSTPLLPGASYTVTRSVLIPAITTPGSYYFRVVTNDSSSPVQPETSIANNSASSAVSIVLDDVNLKVTGTTAPSDIVVGTPFNFSWTVGNVGTSTASNDWFDAVYLSDDQVLDGNDQVLSAQSAAGSSPLAPGGSYTLAASATLQSGLGPKYLIFKTDVNSQQPETNDGDNAVIVPINLTAADLVVDSVAVPNSAVFGQPFDITYTVRNAGTAATTAGGWTDRLIITNQGVTVSYILSDSFVILGDPLEPGESYTRTVSVTVPAIFAAGLYQIGIGADIFQQQAESNNGNNVIVSNLFPVSLLPTPDLVITNVVSPVSGYIGQAFSVTWTVTNQGTTTAHGPWVDVVRFAPSQQIIGTFTNNADLAPGESITRTETFTFPTLVGQYSISITTDDAQQIPEGANESNTYTTSLFGVSVPPLPDLVVTDIDIPPDGIVSGSSVGITFTVKNVGATTTQQPIWTDYVFISTDPNVIYPSQEGTDDDLIVRQRFQPVGTKNLSYLDPGQSYTQTIFITIPLDAAGPYYVYVFPNGLGFHYPLPTLNESNRSNNLTRSDAFSVTLAPAPDLIVSNVVAPFAAFSGQLATVQWTVTNQGPGLTGASSWLDRVYLSTDSTLDASDLLLSDATGQSDFGHEGRLQSGESYTNAASLLLPNGIAGPYYFIVKTDTGLQVFEAGFDSNNAAPTSAATIVNLTPPPDLEVTNVTTVPAAIAGNAINVTYTVGNFGSTPTPVTNIIDRIYLSADDQIDASDTMLTDVWGYYGSLAVGKSYTQTRTVILPVGIAGSYHILVKSDQNQAVFEVDRANNIASSAPLLIASKPADLVVANLMVSSSVEAGQVAAVTWTVSNQGIGDTVATRWLDKIYITTDGTVANARMIGYKIHNGLLNAGDSYTTTLGVTIPFDIQGTAQIFVVSDAILTPNELQYSLPVGSPFGQVFEDLSESDNSSVLTPILVNRVTPDLSVVDFSTPDSAETGQTITLSWTIGNQGGPTNSDHWMDDIYLSSNQTLDSSDIRLNSLFHSGILANGGTYTASFDLNLANAFAAGTYYLIVQTDRLFPTNLFDDQVNLVNEGFSEANNLAVRSITLAAAPTADLVVTSVTVPGSSIAGRSVGVSWTVQNQGIDTTQSWRDSVYLSLDQTLDTSSDRFLGSINHIGGLAQGASYAQSGVFNLPSGFTGQYYIFVKTDAGNDVFERSGESNNTFSDSDPIDILLGQPVDFVVGSINVPNSATVGASATISYSVSNLLNIPVAGGWSDSIYLSADDTFDSSDYLFAKVSQSTDLAAGQGYSKSVTAALPVLPPGNYRVIIRTDILNQVAETHEANNIGVSLDVAAVDAQPLNLGIPLNASLAAGSYRLYRVNAVAGQTLRFSWDSETNTSATELFVKFGSIATRSSYDFRSETPYDADTEITVPNAQAGTYYVLVYTSQGTTDGTILAENLPFTVRSASPTSAANHGPATLEINGSLFTRGTQFEIVAHDGTTIAAMLTFVTSSTKAYATFDLNGKPIGTYDLRAVSTNGETSTATGALTIIDSLVGGQLATSVTVPKVSLAGSQDVFYITYTNTGVDDIVAPLLTVHSPTITAFGTSVEAIDIGEDAILYGASPDGPAGILRPGQSITIPFVFRNVTSVGQAFTFQLFYYDANDTSPINWDSVEELIDSRVRAAADYPQILTQLKSQIGSTMGDYVRMLSRNANLAPGGIDTARNDGALLNMEVMSAVAATRTSLAGKLITDDLGTPIADQDVIARNIDTGESFYTVSRADGSFLFETLTAGTYAIEFGGGIVLPNQSIFVDDDAHVAGFNVHVERGFELSGNVLSGLLPIANAKITASLGDGTSAIAFSDASGKFSLIGLKPGMYTLVVESTGYARAIVDSVDLTSSDATRSITLTTPSSIFGTVSLDPGGPAGAVTQIIVTATNGNPNLTFGATTIAALFNVTGLTAGTYNITISRTGYVSQTLSNVVIGSGSNLNIGDTHLQRAAIVRGQVLSNDPSNQTNPIYIQLLQNGVVVASSPADVDGNFEIAGLAAGSYEIRPLLTRGYSNTEQVTLTAGQELNDLAFIVEAGAAISGHAFDSASTTPLAHVAVTLLSSTGKAVQVFTDNSGAYSFTSLDAGNYVVFISASGADASHQISVPYASGQIQNVDLSAAITSHLGGQVRTSTGDPISQCFVALMDGDRLITTSSTDANGRYDFYLLAPGTYQIRAFAPGASFASATETVAAGEIIARDFVAGTSSISLTTNINGAPASGAVVQLIDSTGLLIDYAQSDDNGNVTFSNLVGGNYKLVAVADGQLGSNMTLSLGEASNTTTTLNLIELGSLSGSVTKSGGVAVSNASVIIYEAGTSNLVQTVSTGEDGAFALNNLTNGTYDVVVYANGLTPSIQSVIISGATLLNATLSSNTATVNGMLVDETGQTVVGGLVVVTDAAGHQIGHAVTSAGGTFQITSASGTGLILTASANGYLTSSLTAIDLLTGTNLNLGNVQITAAALASFVEATATDDGLLTSLNDGSGALPALLASFAAQTRGEAWLSVIQDLFQEMINLIIIVSKYQVPGPPTCPECEDLYKKAVDAYSQMIKQTTVLNVAGEKMLSDVISFGAIVTGESGAVIGRCLLAIGLIEFLGAASTVAGATALLEALGVTAVETVIAENLATGIMVFKNSILFKNAVQGLATAIEDAGKMGSGTSGSETHQNNDKFIADGSKIIAGVNSLVGIFTKLPLALGPRINEINAIIGQIFADPFKNTNKQADKVDDDTMQFKLEKFKLELLRDKYLEALVRYENCNEQNRDCDDDHGGGGGGGGSGSGFTGARKDPNDIAGPDGFGDPRFVSASDALSYKIQFENVSSATLPVQHLVITSQLDSDLDFRTVRFGSFGWGDLTITLDTALPYINQRVDLTSTLGILVDVVATIDVTTRVMTWNLTAIDPSTGEEPLDERIGFLPPNTDDGIGEGFVTYTAHAKTPSLTGTIVDASATIIFDTEEPLDTPTWTNTIDADSPESQVTPLAPAYSGNSFLVNWSSGDPVGGAGLKSTTIYVSENGGSFVVWLTALAGTNQALFTGTLGSSYAFFSVAEDNAGNRETVPNVADAGTFLTPPAPALNVNGPSSGVRQQELTFVLTASNVAPLANGFYLYAFDWDDDGNVDEYANGAATLSITHQFSEIGASNYRVSVVDADLSVIVDTIGAIDIIPFAVEPDASDPTRSVFIFSGTDGDDRYVIDPAVGLLILKENGVDTHQIIALPTQLAGIVIVAGKGNDYVDASLVNDVPVTLVGGDGDDTLIGSQSADTIDGDGGEGRGNDVVDGQGGDDTLWGDGAEGFDVTDQFGRDTINGGAGNDIIHGDGAEGSNDDVLQGDSGNDTIYADGAEGYFEGTEYGKDTVSGGTGDDVIDADGAEGANDSIAGDQDNDIILAGGGSDAISAGAGNDIVIAGLGNDHIEGNGGSDLLVSGVATGVDAASLVLIQAEWTSSRPIASRVDNILGQGTGPRSNGNAFLQPGNNLLNDHAVDTILGGENEDWFIVDAEADDAPDYDSSLDLLLNIEA